MPRNDIARPSFSVFQLLFNPSSLSFSRIDILDQFVASFGQNANRGSSILARFEINFFLLGFLTEKNDKPLSEIKGEEDRERRVTIYLSRTIQSRAARLARFRRLEI